MKRNIDMTVEKLMDTIGLPLEGRRAVSEYLMTDEAYERFKKLAMEDEEAFLSCVRNTENKECMFLYLYVRMAAEWYEEIVHSSVADNIYFDTCRDIAIWCGNCVKKRHKPGIICEDWLLKIVKQKVWRLGRLQFEPDGEVLHVHIPEGEPLVPEACDCSFEAAREFFGGKYLYFDCCSWLLSPELKKLLPMDSNILNFQRRFKVYAIYFGYPQAEERIFGFVSERKEDYPEKTSLQKRAKAFYMEGNDIGMGYGAAGFYEI